MASLLFAKAFHRVQNYLKLYRSRSFEMNKRTDKNINALCLRIPCGAFSIYLICGIIVRQSREPKGILILNNVQHLMTTGSLALKSLTFTYHMK